MYQVSLVFKTPLDVPLGTLKFRIIKPPGWKHDGTGKLSDDLRNEWIKNRQNELQQ